MQQRNPGITFKSDRQRDNLEPLKRFLLEQGDDIDVRDHEGLTLLHKAIADQNLELARELIFLGADVNATDAPWSDAAARRGL
jgi:ankyrin repeat protein